MKTGSDSENAERCLIVSFITICQHYRYHWSNSHYKPWLMSILIPNTARQYRGSFTVEWLNVEHLINLKIHQSFNKQLDVQSRIWPLTGKYLNDREQILKQIHEWACLKWLFQIIHTNWVHYYASSTLNWVIWQNY